VAAASRSALIPQVNFTIAVMATKEINPKSGPFSVITRADRASHK
jgi:hypothetical protein